MAQRSRKPAAPGLRKTATAPVPPGGPEFYTPIELARVLRLGLNQTYQAIHRGEIKGVKIGGSIRISAAEKARLERGGIAAQ
jgi:excisionase family DNA binding protein